MVKMWQPVVKPAPSPAGPCVAALAALAAGCPCSKGTHVVKHGEGMFIKLESEGIDPPTSRTFCGAQPFMLSGRSTI